MTVNEVALLVTSSTRDGGMATLVDVRTGTQVAYLKNSAASSGATALIAGDFVVSAQVKGTALHFWAWGTEQPRLKFHAPEKLGPLAVSCDGSLCAGGGISGRVYVWEVSSGTLLRTWDAHYKAVSALTFSPDGGFLYSGGEDAMLSCWNMLEVVDPEGRDSLKGGGRPSLRATWTASEHTLPVTCVYAGVGGGRVFSSSLDRSAKAWDACSGRLLLSVTCPVFLRAVCADPSEAFLFAGGGNGVIFQVDIGATAIAATASDAALGSSGAFAAEEASEEDHDASWGLRIPEAGGAVSGGGGGVGRQELHGHEKAITSLAVTSDSSMLVSGSEDATMRTWHVASRQCVHKAETPTKGEVSQVILLPLPEALVVRASGAGRKKQSVPLAPFDKFVRTSTKGRASTGFDFSAGCTPVILTGRPCPRGRLGLENITAESDRQVGIRAVLAALDGRMGGGGLPARLSGGGGVDARERGLTHGRDSAEEEERASKVTRLESEIERLRGENRRWQQVNTTLYKKLAASGVSK